MIYDILHNKHTMICELKDKCGLIYIYMGFMQSLVNRFIIYKILKVMWTYI